MLGDICSDVVADLVSAMPLRSRYALASCDKSWWRAVRAIMSSTTVVRESCLVENVATILRDAPNARLRFIRPARTRGRRVDASLARLLRRTGNLRALGWIGFHNSSPCGFKTLVGDETEHLNIEVDKVPRWKQYLFESIECDVRSMRLSILELPPLRVVKWLFPYRLESSLRRLDVACDVHGFDRAVWYLPPRLEWLSVCGHRPTADVAFVSACFIRLRWLTEFRAFNCLRDSAFMRAFLEDMLLSGSVRVPIVLGLDPFPEAALVRAVENGHCICMCTSTFSDEEWATEYIRSRGRDRYYCACCTHAS